MKINLFCLIHVSLFVFSCSKSPKELFDLAENNLKILQNIVKKQQNAKMKFKDNKRATVDLFTASAIMKVYDAVKPDNKKKMEKLINGTLPEFLKLQAFAMKQVKMK